MVLSFSIRITWQIRVDPHLPVLLMITQFPPGDPAFLPSCFKLEVGTTRIFFANRYWLMKANGILDVS